MLYKKLFFRDEAQHVLMSENNFIKNKHNYIYISTHILLIFKGRSTTLFL